MFLFKSNAMKFIKVDILSLLEWNETKATIQEAEKAVLGYYSQYLPNAIGASECPYKLCKELYGSETTFDVSEEVELDTEFYYSGKEFRVIITSYIDVNLAGTDASDYVYKIEVL